MSRYGVRRRVIAAVVGLGAAAASAGLALADPPADFTVAPDTPELGVPATFTAQDACAPPVSCSWSFGDGETASGREVVHAFAAAGPHTVTLTVDDPVDPAPASVASQVLTVATVEAAPAAAFTVSPDTPRKNDTVTFDGRASSDPDGDALTFVWDFDGDGTPDAEGAEVTHVYPAAGSYQATLTVSDGALSQSAFRTVVVASAPPVAGITPSATTPRTGEAVTFGSASTDSDGSIAAWRWDLHGDGAFDDGTEPTASATYDRAGPRTVSLEVRDNDGQVAVTSVTITVLNQDPTAAFTMSPDPAPQEQPVTFNSQSTDPEGTALTHAWDLDGDGEYDDGSDTSATTIFTSTAVRSIGLRVTDADGGVAERRVDVQPGNQVPAAGFTIDPESPLSGDFVTFNSTSADPDGAIAAHEWDLDGDGEFDDATGPTATATFPIPGSRTARLRVTDEDGGSATAQATFTVVNRPPIAAFESSAVVKHQPVVFTSTSVDPEGRQLSAEWDFGDDGTVDAQGTTATHVFTSSATVTVRLTVADEDGGRDSVAVAFIPGNLSPTALLTQSPGAVLTGDPVTLTAAAADADGSVARVEWDLGAGFAPGDAAIQTAYAVPGRYPVAVRVTDNDGASVTQHDTVLVGNRKPVSRFSYAPALVVKGKQVTFSSQAADPEGRMAALEWDLDGDGAFDDATGSEAERAFTGAGATSVGLRARDQDGGEDEFRLSLVPGNKAPSASFAFAPAASGLGATFTATAEDDDGTVARVEWDFDDDDAYDDGARPVAFWTFPAAGSHRVSLRVTDDDGSSAVASRRVTIGGGARAADGDGGAAPTAPGGSPGTRAGGLRLLAPWPVIRIAGTLTKRGAHLQLLSVKGPRGARIRLACKGACPRRALARRAGRRAVRLTPFERSLRAGTVLEIRVVAAARIGKYTRIRIRKGKAPARRDACVWPGRRGPVKACPSSS